MRSLHRPASALLLAAIVACSGREVAPSPAPTASASAPPSASSAAAPTSASSAPLEPERAFASTDVYALEIRGGLVVDGSGHAARKADVLVKDGAIAYVGLVDPSVRAERMIDADGAVVAPGFIDAHAHADPMGDVESELAQGVTTIVIGQDGTSPARDIAGYLRRVDASRPRVEVATLAGHATLRADAGVGAKFRPKDRERLADLASKAMKDGAFGLSTGLEYDGGKPATMDELVAIAEPVGRAGGVVMSHLRSEDDDKIEASLDELLEQCERSGARAHVSHIKSVLGHGRARADALLAKLARAREGGLEITADIYPYTASYTTIGILFPDFARPPHDYADARAKRHDDLAKSLRATVERRNGPEATVFGDGTHAGHSLAEVAKAEGIPFEEVLARMGPNGGSAAYFVMDDELQSALLEDPFVMIGTDGGGGRHPRGFGTFARVIEEYVEKRHALSIEEAIRKMTSLPAHTLRLDGTIGCIDAGCAADLVVFSPAEVHARASFADPHLLAEGMRFVVVRGEIEREGDRATSARGGRALRFTSKP